MERIGYFFLICILVAFCGEGCSDKIGKTGGSVRPLGDSWEIYSDTFGVDVNSYKVEGIFSKLPNSALGVFDDPILGKTQSDYMAEFYFPTGFSLPENIVKTDENREFLGINQITLRLYYTGFMGQLTHAQGVKVYKCEDKPFASTDRVTNIDISNYCTQSEILREGEGYKDVSDSTNHYIEVELKRDIAKEVTNGVPRIYVTNPEEGLLLNISYTDMVFHYKVKDEGSSAEKEMESVISVTKEVLQLNHVENTPTEEVLKPNDSVAYLHAPVDAFAKVTFPEDFVKKLLTGENLNAVNFNLPCASVRSDGLNRAMPEYLLLLQASEVDNFFKTQRTYDGITSFLARLDSTKNSSTSAYEYGYNFYNIASYFIYQVEKAPQNSEDWKTLAVVPVMVTRTSSGAILRVDTHMYPASVKLLKGTEKGKVSAVYSQPSE